MGGRRQCEKAEFQSITLVLFCQSHCEGVSRNSWSVSVRKSREFRLPSLGDPVQWSECFLCLTAPTVLDYMFKERAGWFFPWKAQSEAIYKQSKKAEPCPQDIEGSHSYHTPKSRSMSPESWVIASNL